MLLSYDASLIRCYNYLFKTQGVLEGRASKNNSSQIKIMLKLSGVLFGYNLMTANGVNFVLDPLHKGECYVCYHAFSSQLPAYGHTQGCSVTTHVHHTCLNCIEQWAKRSKLPTCPLYNRAILHINGKVASQYKEKEGCIFHMLSRLIDCFDNHYAPLPFYSALMP